MAADDMIKSISERITTAANINTVVGEPRVISNRAIIPVAVVAGGFGGGGGEGSCPGSEEKAAQGSGGGGGGAFMIRPLAFIEVSDDKTRLIPILDMTRIILAGIGILGGTMWAISKMCKSRRR